MTEQTPETIDLDAWLSDARLPEHEVRIYKRPDLMAKADAVMHKARTLEAIPREERSGEDDAEIAGLIREYEGVLAEFAESGLMVRVRAMRESEIKALRARIDAGEVLQEKKAFHEMAISAVSPRMTPEQAEKLSETIGAQQAQLIWDTIFKASGEQPEVSPHFLQRLSGLANGKA
uniref:hypothetical protein n=1 Tax=Arthrobacter silvisoli TaxID=2291022 RepID=UPI003F4967C2